MGGVIIFRAPLQVQATKTKDGFTRAIAIVPAKMKVLYLGVEPVSSAISIWGAAPDRPRDAEGNPKPFDPAEMGHIEFITATEGQLVPESYQFRATVPTATGILFLFEKQKSAILMPGGRG